MDGTANAWPHTNSRHTDACTREKVITRAMGELGVSALHGPTDAQWGEPGTMLVSHPISTLLQPEFHQSVVLLCEGNNASVMGVVLNAPTPSTIGKFLPRAAPAPIGPVPTPDQDPSSAREHVLEPFRSNRIFKGGPCFRDQKHVLGNLSALHTFNDLAELSAEVFPGLYLCMEVEALAEYVRSGKAEASDFTFFVGDCAWERERLDLELERGVWFGASMAGEAVEEGEGKGGDSDAAASPPALRRMLNHLAKADTVRPEMWGCALRGKCLSHQRSRFLPMWCAWG